MYGWRVSSNLSLGKQPQITDSGGVVMSCQRWIFSVLGVFILSGLSFLSSEANAQKIDFQKVSSETRAEVYKRFEQRLATLRKLENTKKEWMAELAAKSSSKDARRHLRAIKADRRKMNLTGKFIEKPR